MRPYVLLPMRKDGVPALIAIIVAASLSLTWSWHRVAEAAIPVVEPPAANDGRIRIPSIGVDAPLGSRQVAADGTLPMPYGPVDVSWYDFGLHPGLGGVPVVSGNTVLSGHVDYVANVPYAGVRYSGPAVFYDLGKLRPGARIEISRSGVIVVYRVTSAEILPAEQADWYSVFSATPVETLTLFTCTGEFNPRTVEYSDRIVVKAVRVLGAARQLSLTGDGRFLYGVGGTSDPVELAAAQSRSITALYSQDPKSGQWLTFVPGAPGFINTLSGRLGPEALVIARVAP
ncbi:MAG: class F sortase [Dehalococcoidia bacterium]|nr:MAG: class F sortase [Dehalococcoidia bacterium]